MNLSLSTRLVAAACGLAVAGTASAHDDDYRKLLDKIPSVPGNIWSLGDPVPRDGGFDADGITCLSHIPLNNFAGVDNRFGNDCWGYTSPSGREYAIMGLYGGFAFVEITDPTNPVIVDTVVGPGSDWHDVKVVGAYAYGVSEGGSGIQVMDMRNIDSGTVPLVRNFTTGGYQTTHNIVTNEEAGTLWICGGNVGNGGLLKININNPANPSLLSGWTDMYVHDAQVATMNSGPFAGREIAFCASGLEGGISQTGLRIVDVTNPNAPVLLSTLFYSTPGYSHQVWLSDDQQTLYLNDELDEDFSLVSTTTTRVIDVSDLNAPVELPSFTTGLPSIDHNLYVRDSIIYMANYRSGLRVFDGLDPRNPTPLAYFDTFPGSDAASFNGAWSNYPYFPSGNIIVSDIERGLFVLRLDAQPVPFVVLSGSQPGSVSPEGGEAFTADVLVRDPDGSAPIVELLFDSGDGFVAIPMTENPDGTYSADAPGAPCGSEVRAYYRVSDGNGFEATDPPNAPAESFAFDVVTDATVAFDDNFETNTGWSVTGNAGAGVWERAVPTGAGQRGDPEADFDGSGRCYITENGPPGENTDVDDGTTILTSPAFDATGEGTPELSYALWYDGNEGSTDDDTMTVEISNNNGGSWTVLDSLGPSDPRSNGGWNLERFDVSSVFATPSSQVRVRFVVNDLGGGSIVEAGVDRVRLEVTSCDDTGFGGCSAADLAEPFGTLNFFDLGQFLNAFNAGDPSADLAAPAGVFNFFDLGEFLNIFNQGCPG